MAETDKKPKIKAASKSSAEEFSHAATPDASIPVALNREQLEIINWLREVRFRKQLFGGVNEQDVWKKIEKLSEMYDAALKAERIRYNVLLEQQRSASGQSSRSGDQTKESPVDE